MENMQLETKLNNFRNHTFNIDRVEKSRISRPKTRISGENFCQPQKLKLLGRIPNQLLVRYLILFSVVDAPL